MLKVISGGYLRTNLCRHSVHRFTIHCVHPWFLALCPLCLYAVLTEWISAEPSTYTVRCKTLLTPHFYIFYFQEAKVSCYLFSALEQYLLKLSEKPLKFSLDIGCFLFFIFLFLLIFRPVLAKKPPKNPMVRSQTERWISWGLHKGGHAA